MVGALALLAALQSTVGLSAQSAATLTVEDSSGVALAGAAVEDSQGKLLGRTGADGRLTVACSVPCRVRVRAGGFAERDFELTGDTTIRLEPAAVAEKVMVTAYRAPLGSLESPVTTRLLSEKALEHYGDDHFGRPVAADSRCGVVSAVQLTGCQSHIAGNQFARIGFYLGQPDSAY